MADLVLVNPNSRNPAPFAAIEPPLWAGLMAGDALAHGRSVGIVDAEAENLSLPETVDRVRVYDPKELVLVCMGNNPSVSSTPKWPATEELLARLPGAKVTGIHPLAVNHPKAVRFQPEVLPRVPWGLLPMEKYLAHNWHCLHDPEDRAKYAVLYTSLNCPFGCYYCNVHTLYGDRRVRYRDLHDIFDELRLFANAGYRHIKIWDECFTMNRDRVQAICEHIVKHAYRFNMWAYARADAVNPAMLYHMKKAGVNWLAYGFESSSFDVRSGVDKMIDEASMLSAIAMTREAGINIMGNFIFGLPGETIEDRQATLDMACRENFEYVNFYVAMPYPGSDWYRDLKYKPSDWRGFSQYGPSVAASDVVGFRDRAFQTYFRRPEYLTMIEGKFGLRAVTHLQSMVEWNVREVTV